MIENSTRDNDAVAGVLPRRKVRVPLVLTLCLIAVVVTAGSVWVLWTAGDTHNLVTSPDSRTLGEILANVEPVDTRIRKVYTVSTGSLYPSTGLISVWDGALGQVISIFLSPLEREHFRLSTDPTYKPHDPDLHWDDFADQRTVIVRDWLESRETCTVLMLSSVTPRHTGGNLNVESTFGMLFDRLKPSFLNVELVRAGLATRSEFHDDTDTLFEEWVGESIGEELGVLYFGQLREAEEEAKRTRVGRWAR